MVVVQARRRRTPLVDTTEAVDAGARPAGVVLLGAVATTPGLVRALAAGDALRRGHLGGHGLLDEEDIRPTVLAFSPADDGASGRRLVGSRPQGCVSAPR